MGIWGGVKKVGQLAEYAATLGKSADVQRLVAEYDLEVVEFERLRQTLAEETKSSHEALHALGLARKRAAALLRSSHSLIRRMTANRVGSGQAGIAASRSILTEESSVRVEAGVGRVSLALRSFDQAVASAKGAGTAAAAGLGSWALVGAFGTASTGASISGLSGAAATNATLAWFGGGSLAVGGGGIAVGTLVLTSVVAIPAVIATVAFSYNAARKREKQVSEALVTVQATNTRCREALRMHAETQGRVREIHKDLDTRYWELERLTFESRMKLFPIPLLSRARRWLRSLFGDRYFLPDEIATLEEIVASCGGLVDAIEAPVFDGDGSVKARS